MKFQNPSFNFFEQVDGRTDGRENGWTSRNQYPPHIFKVLGIRIRKSVEDTGYSLKTGGVS